MKGREQDESMIVLNRMYVHTNNENLRLQNLKIDLRNVRHEGKEGGGKRGLTQVLPYIDCWRKCI